MEQLAQSFNIVTILYNFCCLILLFFLPIGISFYTMGLIRQKNFLSLLCSNILIFSVALITFVFVGYPLITSVGGSSEYFLPNLGQLFANILEENNNLTQIGSATIFAILGHGIIVSYILMVINAAGAERLKPTALLFFSIFFAAIIYPLLVAWCSKGNLLASLGYIDASRIGLVHLTAGTCGLITAIMVKPRHGKYNLSGEARPIPGENITLSTLGFWFLLLGLIANYCFFATDINILAKIFLHSFLAVAAGAIIVSILNRLIFGAVDITLIFNGSMAGLIVIGAALNTLSPIKTMILAATAAVLTFYAIIFLEKRRLDDPTGVITTSIISSLLGILLTPLFDESTNFSQQLLGSLVIILYVAILCMLGWVLTKIIFGLRMNKQSQTYGADLTMCAVEANPKHPKDF